MVEMPSFTVEEYYNTERPYEWLYQYQNNKFLLRQLCERMKEQAGSLGVRAFMALWNAYCEAQAQKQGMRLENATNFENQEIELFSGEYICDDLEKFGYDTIESLYSFDNIRCYIDENSLEFYEDGDDYNSHT